MKPHRRLSDRGAVLIFALLIVVVAASILGGMVQLAATQALAGQTEWVAAARRIQLENSRALARQYILSQMWRGYGGLVRATLTTAATGGAGGFSLASVDPGSGFWLSLRDSSATRINPFTIFERGGFQSAWVSGSLSAGGGDVPWGFQIRTRSPIVAGFAFVNQRPANNNWQPTRRINMWSADYAAGFTALPRMPVSSVTNTSTGDTTGFLGFLAVPKAEASFVDPLAAVGGVTAATNSSDTNAQIRIELETFGRFPTSGLQFYEVPFAADIVTVTNGTTNTNYALPITSLVLVGAPPTSDLPVQIVIPSGNTSLTNVTLSGNNGRFVYLYRQGAAAGNLIISTTGGNSEFLIGMTLDCPADFRIAGGLTIVGGIRTGSAITQSTGNTLVLRSAESPTWGYDAIADRMMWLEDQRMR